MPAELTEDEFTVLLLADDGMYMAPIGRWKEPILSLTAKGYMRKCDVVNYTITETGHQARVERDNADDKALLDALNRAKVIAGEVIEEPLLAEELKNGGT
jgi:hypothetical protein